jgi:hypothetical protein
LTLVLLAIAAVPVCHRQGGVFAGAPPPGAPLPNLGDESSVRRDPTGVERWLADGANQAPERYIGGDMPGVR